MLQQSVAHSASHCEKLIELTRKCAKQYNKLAKLQAELGTYLVEYGLNEPLDKEVWGTAVLTIGDNMRSLATINQACVCFYKNYYFFFAYKQRETRRTIL